MFDPFSAAFRVANSRPAGRGGRLLADMSQLFVRCARKFQPHRVVSVPIHQRSLLMPWSLNLPKLLAEIPCYEAEIGRLAAYLEQIEGHLCMIDVGANVGDTIASLPPLQNA